MKLSTLALIIGTVHAVHAGNSSIAQNTRKRTVTNPNAISIKSVSFTSKWMDPDYTQVLEVTVHNDDDAVWLYEEDNFVIRADTGGVHTIVPGKLKRLRSGDSAVVQVGVQNDASLKPGAACSVTFTTTWGGREAVDSTFTGICGFGPYSPSKDSITWHKSPQWYDDAKFGIFIHWGIYSVPAYGNQGDKEEYAEWYWSHMHNSNDKTRTYYYHRDTYGENINYDDFISGFPASNGKNKSDGFTALKFDAKGWIDLIAAAGAEYMVLVTKHHDGFALFNFTEDISKRSSVHLGPKRDFLRELFDAAVKYHPKIHRGTYFSMPEWYNPAYPPNTLGGFPGGPPSNPYTNAKLSYTGYVTVGDFVNDIQLKQMQVLAKDYDAELMWCDMGGPNNASQFLADWYNSAYSLGRQVAVNDRCGYNGGDIGDFGTPEYDTRSDSSADKWESNRGIDPYSFGYNRQTPDSAYMSIQDIIYSLVDIVSKNGNFLLDIGPEADGTIREIIKTNLIGAGNWITSHAESIFATRFYQHTWGFDSSTTPNLRFTTTDDAFYIHALGLSDYAGSGDYDMKFESSLPFDGIRDVVTVVGGEAAGTVVTLLSDNGQYYTLKVPAAVVKADQYVWTFKITYK